MLTVQILYVEIQTLRVIILYLDINVAREYLGLFYDSLIILFPHTDDQLLAYKGGLLTL